MHPELQRIEDQYLQLVASVQAGHMSEDEGIATIGRVAAVDGDGAAWTIDPYSGLFSRAFPGQSPEPANPALFAPGRLPAPPGGDVGMPGPWGVPPTVGGFPPTVPGMPVVPLSPAAVGLGVPPAGVQGKKPGLLSRLPVSRRTAVLILVVVVVVTVLVGAKLSSSSSVDEMPAPAGQEAPVVVDGPVPSAEQAAAVLSALSSGRQKQAMSLMGTVPDKPSVLLSVASISGAKSLGFSFDPAVVTATSDGVLLSVNVVGAGAARGTVLIPVSASGDGWVLSGPVTLER